MGHIPRQDELRLRLELVLQLGVGESRGVILRDDGLGALGRQFGEDFAEGSVWGEDLVAS
jgi:hypothetical protein